MSTTPQQSAAGEPGDEESLTAFVRAHIETGVGVCPRGSGSKFHFVPAPDPAADVVSLARMNRIIAHEPGDLVVTVQAGIRLQDLQTALARHGQWLPIDPPFADATIGGILATASTGPRRLGYGPVRDHVLGMRVVGQAGVITRSGARVVKNVAGFDLHKLHTGAFGSLGVIVEANFKVTPRPESSSALVLGFPDTAAAHTALLGVWRSHLHPVALEIWDGSEADRLRALVSGLPAASALAVIGVDGSKAKIERHRRDLKSLQGVDAAWLEGERTESLWTAFRRAPEQRRSALVLRLGARPGDLPRLVGEFSPRGGCAISVGTGVARIVLPAEETGAHLAAWQRSTAAVDGTLVVESAPPLANRDALPWRPSDMMLAIKRAWDPRGLFNPGWVPS